MLGLLFVLAVIVIAIAMLPTALSVLAPYAFPLLVLAGGIGVLVLVVVMEHGLEQRVKKKDAEYERKQREEENRRAQEAYRETLAKFAEESRMSIEVLPGEEEQRGGFIPFPKR